MTPFKFLSLLGTISFCCASPHDIVGRGKVGLVPSVSPVQPAVPLATAQAISKQHSKHVNEFYRLYGWLPPGASVPDSELPKAIRRIQHVLKEPVTGVLNEKVVDILNRPRCGTEQPYHGTPPPASSDLEKRYVVWGSRWSPSTITWRFINYTADTSVARQQTTLSTSFAQWMTQIPLNIVPAAANAKADINVRFASFGPNDTRYAYTSMVSDGVYFNSGNINLTFNDDYLWADDRLFNFTATHEIGHALGMSHSSVESAVMFAYYGGYIRPLHADDEMGIHTIYGWKNPKWSRFASNSATKTVIQITSPTDSPSPNDGLYQLLSTGQILRNTNGGWVSVDYNKDTIQITGANGNLYQRHTDGSTYLWNSNALYWQYIGAATDNVIDIVAGADQIYARRKDGWVTRWSGSGTTWVTIDQPSAQISKQIAITDSKVLWNLLSTGDLVRSAWPYDSGTWEIVDQNTANVAIATGGEEFYKLQSDGSVVWLNMQEYYWEIIEMSNSVAIYAQGTYLYSRHSDGSVWRYTGTQVIWEMIDNRTDVVSMVGDRKGQVYEIVTNGDMYKLVS